MARSFAFAALVIAVATSGAFVARVPAQQAPMQTELLTEVRLLRQAIEGLAGTNARVQIVFGRLQLQEQRTASAGQRLERVRESLASLNREIAALAEHGKDLDAAIADSRRKPEEIEQAKMEATMMRRQIEQMETDRTRLINDEADASASLNQEQARWSDLNRQLEELERLLAKPQ